MMFAMNGTWNGFFPATKLQQSPLGTTATETRIDAQDLDSSLEFARHHDTIARIANLRIQNWPQFFILWQIIGCVSAYDAFLAMKYQQELMVMEQNWLGILLLFANDGDPALFLSVKFLGTTMVLGILANLYHSRPQWGMVIAKGVAAFQMGLLAYLTWA